MLHHNYCIIKKFIYQIGNSEVKENPTEKKLKTRRKKKKKKKKQFLRPLRIAVNKDILDFNNCFIMDEQWMDKYENMKNNNEMMVYNG